MNVTNDGNILCKFSGYLLQCWREPLAKGHPSSFTKREPVRFTLVLTSTFEYVQEVIQAFLPLCEADIIISKTFRKHLIFMFFRKQGLLKLNYYGFAYTSFLPRGDGEGTVFGECRDKVALLCREETISLWEKESTGPALVARGSPH